MTETSTPSAGRSRRPRRAAAHASLYGRSAVSNASRLLQNADLRTAEARRLRDLIDGFAVQYGCVDEGDLALCRGAARLALMLEQRDAQLVRGEPVDLGDTARATSRLQRILRELLTAQRQRKRGLR